MNLKRTLKWTLAGTAGMFAAVIGIGIAAGGDTAGQNPTDTASTATATASRPTVPATQPRQTFAVDPPPPVELGPADAITAREWQIIARDPDSAAGDRIIVYGQVTQFDAATGTENFRANVGGVEEPLEDGFTYADYDTNTVLSGEASDLKAVVNGDTFRAEVTVVGSMDYDTQIGGSTTVPWLLVDKITVLDSPT